MNASTSTPVTFPPLRTTRLTVVFVHRWKLSLSLADTKYVAMGPPRSPFENMNGAWPYVRFFFSGAWLNVVDFQPAFSSPLAIRLGPC